MISKIKKPVSILLVFMMIVSLFTVVPITASAAEYYGAYDVYTYAINELKQGDQISGRYDPAEEIGYLEADYVTIVDYNTGDTIASRVLEWTADKDYEIIQKAQSDISGDFADSFDSAYVFEYTFTIREAKPKYTVTWMNGDTVLKTDKVEEGTTPTYDGTPEKAEDENYTYTFAGWSPEITAVTGDVTYTATYTATAKTKPWTYEITTGGEYTCPSTLPQYTIVSGGTEENPVIINITGLTTVNYPICLLSGYLKIVGNNNTVEANRGFVLFTGSGSYKPNGDAHLTVTDLSFLSTNATNQYIQINSQNYKCQSSLENVTFKNCNINGSGAVVISSETTHTLKNCTFEDNTGYNAGGISFRYGSDVTMEGCTFKNCTRTRPYSTSFLGGGAVWVDKNTKLTLDGCTFEDCTGECGAVGIASTATLTLKGNTTITGNSSGNLYLPTGATVKIDEDFNGTVGVTTETAPTDSASVLLASDLADTQAALANKNIVSDNENYGVIYKDNSLLLINSKVYTVTWMNGDTVLKIEALAEGTTPTYDGTPVKAEDENYTYTFVGWTPEITAVTGDVTYTAQYMATFKGITSDQLYEGLVIDAGTPIKFMIIKSGEGWRRVDLSVYLDGTLVKELVTQNVSQTEPDRYYTTTKKCIVDSYKLTHGDPTRHVLYLKSVYDVTWKNDDGTIIDTTTVANGTTPTHTAPTKAEDANYTYTFAGWTPEITAVTGDITYTATFDATPKTPAATASYVKVTSEPQDWSGDYLIVFEDEEGSKAFNGSANVLNLSGNHIDVTISGDEIESNAATDAAKVTIAQTDGGYSIATATGAYIGGVSGQNKLASSDDAIVNTISLEDDSAKIVSNTSTLRFNTSWDGIGGFRYYKSSSYTSQKSVQLYKLTGGSAPAPAPVKLILNVGENGKVVMDNGTFGNATDASNISEIHGPVNVADGYNASIANVSIVDGHTCNIVEGGSINIATGGEVSFYPSADNTGKITAIPGEGYICTGWYNGDTLYSSDAALSYQSISEDMTLTAKFERELFWKHSVSLGGDIGVNFYLDSAVLDTYTGTKTVKFTCDGEETTVDVPATPTADGYKVTCNVVAAQMAHKIHAVVKADGTALAQTDDYSVQDYAETVFATPEKYDSEKSEQLRALAQALLNYGANAQTVFATSLNEHPALANTTVGNNGYEGVTADQIEGAINGTASDLNAIAEQLGAKYYTNSLIYLSKNTLRIYFTPTSYPGEIPNASAYDGNLSGYYYYVEHANIPAAELDNQQTFTVGGTTFTFSALDYAYAVVESDNMTEIQKNLAKSLYLYNQKANAYFDVAPAPAENEVISSGSIDDFSTLNVGDYIAKGVEYAADIEYKVVLTGGTYGTERSDGIVVRNGDYNFNACEYGMGTYSYHVPQPNVFIEDYNENEKFYPVVDGVEGNAFVVVAKDDTQKIITIAGANVTQN